MEKIKQDLQPLFNALPPWAKWIAKDGDGDVFYYTEKPVLSELDNWWVNNDRFDDYIPNEYIPQSYKDLPWKGSLIEVTKNTF